MKYYKIKKIFNLLEFLINFINSVFVNYGELKTKTVSALVSRTMGNGEVFWDLEKRQRKRYRPRGISSLGNGEVSPSTWHIVIG